MNFISLIALHNQAVMPYEMMPYHNISHKIRIMEQDKLNRVGNRRWLEERENMGNDNYRTWKMPYGTHYYRRVLKYIHAHI